MGRPCRPSARRLLHHFPLLAAVLRLQLPQPPPRDASLGFSSLRHHFFHHGPKQFETDHHAGGGQNLVAHIHQHYRLLCLLAGVPDSNLPSRSAPSPVPEAAHPSSHMSSHFERLDHGFHVNLSTSVRLLLVTDADIHFQLRMLRDGRRCTQ
jgi:hypothetical protein